MVIERKKFFIECNKEFDYVYDIVSYFEEKLENIMSFFELKSLKNKTKIIIFDDLGLYKKHIEQFFEYQDYMRADTMDGNINILSLEETCKTAYYAGTNLDDFKSVLLHEFVHICQQEKEIEPIEEDIVWFWEGLATNLGNPEEYEIIPINATNEDINEFNCGEKNYPISFTIGNYMLEYYSHEEIIEYVRNPKKLLADSQKILDGAREWSKITSKKNKNM